MNPLSAAWSFIKHEPAIILSVVGAGVGAAAVFGLHLNPAETKDVYTATAAVTGLLIRASVTPNPKVAESIAAVESRVAALEPMVNALLPAADRPLALEVEADLESISKQAESPNLPPEAEVPNVAPAGSLSSSSQPPQPSTVSPPQSVVPVAGWRLVAR